MEIFRRVAGGMGRYRGCGEMMVRIRNIPSSVLTCNDFTRLPKSRFYLILCYYRDVSRVTNPIPTSSYFVDFIASISPNTVSFTRPDRYDKLTPLCRNQSHPRITHNCVFITVTKCHLNTFHQVDHSFSPLPHATKISHSLVELYI
jgi:hypothetical protein